MTNQPCPSCKGTRQVQLLETFVECVDCEPATPPLSALDLVLRALYADFEEKGFIELPTGKIVTKGSMVFMADGKANEVVPIRCKFV